jgi:hypothetical protein
MVFASAELPPMRAEAVLPNRCLLFVENVTKPLPQNLTLLKDFLSSFANEKEKN